MKRNYKIDNIKALLIVLVLIGHFYENIKFSSSLFQYLVIYSFHMPAFVFVSGLCFKPSSDNKIYKNLLYPYIVFQTLILIYITFCNERTLSNLTLQYSTPYWALWYLLSLFIWHLLMNVISIKEKGNIIITLSFIIAILIGFDKSIGYYFSLSRTIAYFPFFVWGVYSKSRKDINLKCIKDIRKPTTLFLVIIAIVFLYFNRHNLQASWFYNSVSYNLEGYSWIVRLTNFCIAAIFIVFLTTWIPNKDIPIITNIGKNSLSVYLLHLFIVRFPLFGKFINILPLPILTVPILGILLAIILSLKPIVSIFQPIMKWPQKQKNI